MNQYVQAQMNRTYSAPSSTPRLEGKVLLVARIFWVLLALVGLFFLVTSLPGYALKFSGQLSHASADTLPTGAKFFAAASAGVSLATALLSLGLSWMLFRHRFEEPVAAFLVYYLLVYGIVIAGPLERWGFYWMGNTDIAIILQSALLATPTVLLFAIFPNGRFVPAWMRWVVILSIPWNFSLVYLAPFTTANVTQNPYAFVLLAFWFLGFTLLGIYAQIYRFRRISTLEERQQTKWMVFGLTVWIGYIALSTGPYMYVTGLPPGAPTPWWEPLSELGWWLSLSFIPISLTVAITRDKLWNIDLVVNRTLVYGALTFLTMSLYVIVVSYFGNMLQLVNESFMAFLATGLVALLFQPLRDRLQLAVNHLMYGDRDDPVAVLSKLGEQLEGTGSPEDALSGIVETISRTLRLPYAAIELGGKGKVVASYGAPVSEVIRLPLVYQSDITGYLVVASPSPKNALGPSDLQLLENISHQAGAAAHAAKLTADLRHSRQKLVTTREEERRRLRRDLHDGLGPTLASLTLKMDAARNLLRENPDKAENLLDDLKKQTQDTIQEIRNLVYDLRPPALDELGLTGAIQSYIDGHTTHGPTITLETADNLPALPAAFEVAVYRISLEAITNILRHADANTAAIRITNDRHSLDIDIIDDGKGPPEGIIPGVGLASMKERAEELGGSFEFMPANSGLHIRVRLPLPEE